MCGGRSSILHYGPLIETNNLYVPMLNGQKPECVAKQTQYPPSQAVPGRDLPAADWQLALLAMYPKWTDINYDTLFFIIII